MGTAITALAAGNGLNIITCNRDDSLERVPESDVIIDFSHRACIVPLLKKALMHKKPLIIGTTGHTEEEKESIESAAKEIPVVYSSNFAVGTNVLFHLIETAAAILKDFHPELIEIHHANKKDAPSGTALSLAKILQNNYQKPLSFGRSGFLQNPDDEIGVHALRGGDIVGTHTVHFLGQGESLEFTHRATDRKIFAVGAIKAAHWIFGKKPGLYSMKDVLRIFGENGF